MAKDICEQFGERLRALRASRAWSQEELAHRVGIDLSFLSELENGHKEPCLRKIVELAQGFGMTPSELLKGIA